MSLGHLKEAVEYETYNEYCAPRFKIGLGVIPESLFNALKKESVMFDKFRENMLYTTTLKENCNADGSVNWDFVDADMYAKWSVLLDGETYTVWFDRVADEIEGISDCAMAV